MKRINWNVSLLAVSAILVAPATSLAGWIEQDDAGPFYQGGEFQLTIGSGDLDTITGTTTIPGGVQVGTLFREIVDVFAIRVTDPDNFYATTDSAIDARASATGDTRLFLLDPATGNVLLMNDDTDNTEFKSFIAEPATFTSATGNPVHDSAQSVELVAGQTYLLGVAEFAITALDLTGTMGNLETGDLLNADAAYQGPPDDNLNTLGGVADGNLNLAGGIRTSTDDSDWGSNQQLTNTVEAGLDYVVALQGATYAIPEPSTVALASMLAALTALLFGWRRR